MGDTVARGSAASAHNQARIVELLRKQQTLTKQEIASQLGWSMPTTLQNINDLMERGILQEYGALESTGGRKAKRIGLCREAGLAVGIDVALHHVELVLTDLTGEVRERTVLSHPFRDQPEWYRTLGNELEWFLTACGVDPARVLAAGGLPVAALGIVRFAAHAILVICHGWFLSVSMHSKKTARPGGGALLQGAARHCTGLRSMDGGSGMRDAPSGGHPGWRNLS